MSLRKNGSIEEWLIITRTERLENCKNMVHQEGLFVLSEFVQSNFILKQSLCSCPPIVLYRVGHCVKYWTLKPWRFFVLPSLIYMQMESQGKENAHFANIRLIWIFFRNMSSYCFIFQVKSGKTTSLQSVLTPLIKLAKTVRLGNFNKVNLDSSFPQFTIRSRLWFFEWIFQNFLNHLW